ncbi:MAG: MmgE/PrpD family protein [Dehalococcoidia bacterium]|nr:MmgE/PrpD family protein [Dehalococcoidia bacterium]
MVSAKTPLEQGHTDLLVDLALETRYSDLPFKVAHAAKQIILDTIGCCVAAFATDTARILVNLKRRQGGHGEATLLVDGDRLPVSSVAYVHSQLANLLDLDETLVHRTHFASTIVMPALAMAEMTGASGKELIVAVALGFDVAARVGLSMPFYETSSEDGAHLVPVWGYSWAVFGTVAAAGRLLGLSHEQMANALGIAFVSTPVHFNGPKRRRAGHVVGAKPMHKYAMYAAIAEAGINAVLLAADGFTGDSLVLDPDRSFWKAFGVSPADWDFMVRDLGRRWFIAETSLKFFTVARPGAIPVDLFWKVIRKEGIKLAEIDEVILTLPPAQMVKSQYDTSAPPSQVGPMPVPYACALLASGLDPGLSWLDPVVLAKPEIREFGRKVKTVVNQDLYSMMVDQVKAEGTYRRIPIALEIKARGTSFEASAEYARGDPWGPEPMTDDELGLKFRNYTEALIGRENSDRAIKEVLNLEAAPDVSNLVSSLHR